jgi:cytochrome c peroxidase
LKWRRVGLAAVLAGAGLGGARADELPAKPWENPGFNRPENAQKREDLEYTDMFDHAAARPPRSLRSLKTQKGAPLGYGHEDGLPPMVLLGDMLFHAPKLLGPHPALFGVSCASCHPGGGASRDIFVGAESDRPGNIDLLSNYFTPLADDGVYAPRNVPSLRGVRYTSPYERDGSKASLSDVVAGVVSHEFAQPIRGDWLNALTLYTSQIDFLPNAQLDALGRLTAKASDAARKGEAVFKAARPALDGKSCASCHVPDTFFTDRQTHALHHGKGEHMLPSEAFDTPSLINMVESPPYFFDGSAATLADAVAQIDAQQQLGLSPQDKAELTAYLEAVGATDELPRVPTTAELVSEPLAYLQLVLGGPLQDDAEIWSMCLDTVRHMLRGAVRQASGPERTKLEPLVRSYEQWTRSPEAQKPSAAGRTQLGALREQLAQASAVKTKAPKGAKAP